MSRQGMLQRSDTQSLWLAPSESPTLHHDEVHIWRISLEMTPHQVGMLEQLLSADELEKADRFYFQKDRDHFIVARGMLRSILGKYLRMNPDKLKFYYGPYGKPGLEKKINPGMICFNISHSQGLALCAVAQKREVGVDLEHIRSDISVQDIAEQFFSQREAAALHAVPEKDRPRAFFTAWTRKEAYLKAQGRGLSGDLKQLEVPLGQNELHIPLTLGNALQGADIWSLRDLDAEPGYAAALVVEGNDLQLNAGSLKASKLHEVFDTWVEILRI